MYVPNPGCAIIGGIQPSILPSIFTGESFLEGLFPRFLITQIPRGLFNVSSFSLTDEDNAVWKAYVERLHAIPLQQDHQGVNTPTILTYSKESLEIFISFRRRSNDDGRFASERTRVFLPKIASYVVRLSGILHLLKGSNDPVIPLVTVEASIRMAEYYLGQCVLLVENYGDKGLDSKVESWLPRVLHSFKDVARNGKIPLRDICKAINDELPSVCALTPKAIGGLLRRLELTTQKVGGYSHLMCNEKYIRIINRYERTSTTSTTSTTMLDYSDECVPEKTE
jgi:hypothetical protein